MSRLWAPVLLLVLGSLACSRTGITLNPENTGVPTLPPQAQIFETAAPTLASAPESLANTPPILSSVVTDPNAIQDIFVALYNRVNQGVVAILVTTDQGAGTGSGIVIDKEGHIVTNYHVVEGATDVEIDFASGYKAYGEVIGADTDSDLAVILVEAPAEELIPLPLGDSSALRVGETVIAIGNPFGLNGTMTVGIVSAIGRSLDSLHAAPNGLNFSAGDVIQTDAAINPGNSGGPLLNLQGEVVGVNRAIRTTTTTETGQPSNSGIGFAVSVNIVKRVVPELIEKGSYDYPYLGISSPSVLSLVEIEALNLPRTYGAYVSSVTAGGPAEDAGVIGGSTESSLTGLPEGGDLIIAVDGQPVRVFAELISYLMTYKAPGDEVVLTVLRGEEEMEIPVTLGKRP
jgi:2-alkenal reductase